MTDDYVIGICISVKTRDLGILESLLTGFNVNDFSVFPYAKIFSYFIKSLDELRESCNQFIKSSRNIKNKIFLANYFTYEFITALEIFQGTDIFVFSLGSSNSKINSFINIDYGYSLMYSDKLYTQCLINILNYNYKKCKKYQSIYIVYDEESLFDQSFKDEFIEGLKSMPKNGPQLEAVYSYASGNQMALEKIIDSIKNNCQVYDILIFLAPLNDFLSITAILETFPTPFFIYGNENLDGCSYQFSNKNIYFSLFLPVPMTENAVLKELYERLYAQPNEKYSMFSSFLVPFGYDFARYMLFVTENKIPVGKKSFQIYSTEYEYSFSALQGNWVIEQNSRPVFARFQCITMYDEQWSQNITDFNQLINGFVKTQPKSGAVNFVAGYLGNYLEGGRYFLNIVNWVEIFNKDNAWVMTKPSSITVFVDTQKKYKNNYFSSVATGNYYLYRSDQEKNMVIILQNNNIYEFPNVPPLLNYPIHVQRIHLLI